VLTTIVVLCSAGAVAAPAVLGIGIGLGAYHLGKGNKSDEDNSDKVVKKARERLRLTDE
jgi:hypothetical protein